MSTQCRIAIQRSNGKFEGITVHYDGYPSRIANVISRRYRHLEDIERLISLGNLSHFNHDDSPVIAIEKDGFELAPNDIFETKTDMLDQKGGVLGVAYTYFFDEFGKWYGYYHYSAHDPMSLEEIIKAEDEFNQD